MPQDRVPLSIFKNLSAENDLVDIWIYTFNKWGVIQADKYLNQLDEGFQFLADNPLVGINYDEIRKGYLAYPIKKHTVFYKIESSFLRVIRVLGGEMKHSECLY